LRDTIAAAKDGNLQIELFRLHDVLLLPARKTLGIWRWPRWQPTRPTRRPLQL
jgi:hypothetical protein